MSVPTGGELRFLRRYPQGDLYAHITGFYSIVSGRTELEDSYNDYLAGRAEEPSSRSGSSTRSSAGSSRGVHRDHGRPGAQRLAQDQIASAAPGGGAVAVIDPQTGEVRAMAAVPSYDPNPLASHRPDQARRAYNALDPTSPDTVLLSNANDELYPPGSTFKVVTAAAGLENGLSPDSLLPNPPQLPLADTPATPWRTSGRACVPVGARSPWPRRWRCRATWPSGGLGPAGRRGPGRAGRAVRLRRGHLLRHTLHRRPDLLPRRSRGRRGARLAESYEAKTAIGQQDVRTNPLHMALVAGSIANGGVMMRPRLVNEIRDPEGRAFQTFGPEVHDRVMSQANAEVSSPR